MNEALFFSLLYGLLLTPFAVLSLVARQGSRPSARCRAGAGALAELPACLPQTNPTGSTHCPHRGCGALPLYEEDNMQNLQTCRSTMTHPDCADREDIATAGGHANLAELVAEARAIVAGADIRPTRAHLWACLSWLDGCPPQMVDAPFEH